MSLLEDFEQRVADTVFFYPQVQKHQDMLHLKKVDAQTQNEQTSEVITFNFSEQQVQVRTLMDNGQIYFVGSDVAKTLGYNQPHKAIKRHCRHGTKRTIGVITGKKTNGTDAIQQVEVLTIPEGDVFRLIIHSKLPSAQKFESWVMDDVLPTLRKKGYYSMSNTQQNDFIDARDVPYDEQELNGFNIRFVKINNEVWFSVNDIHKAIGSSTGSNQSVKKLNAVQTLAVKIFLFGNTHPAWFTNSLGFRLLLSGSRILRDNRQLSLDFGGNQKKKGGAK